jgi:hypothetical protein
MSNKKEKGKNEKPLTRKEIEKLMGIRRPIYEKRGGVIKQRGGRMYG